MNAPSPFRHLTAVAALAAVAVVAACSAQSSGASNSGPIKVAITQAMSGGTPPGLIALNEQINGGFLSYIDKVNAAGGIDGRKIDVLQLDDQTDPSLALTLIRRAVEQDQIIAVGSISSAATYSAILPYLKAQRIPLVSAAAGFLSTVVPVDANIFTVQTPLEVQGAVAGRYIVESLGVRTIGYAGYNDLGGYSWGHGFAQGVKAAGGTIVLTDEFPRGQTDFSGLITKLRNAGAKAVAIYGSPTELTAVLQAADARDYRPAWYTGPGATDPSTITLAGELAEGVYGAVPYQLPNADSAQAKLFRDTVDKYDSSVVKGVYTEYGYSAAQALVAALRGIDGGITRESFRAALESAKLDPAEMLFTPQAVGPDSHVFNSSIQVVQFKAGQMTAVGEPSTGDLSTVKPYSP